MAVQTCLVTVTDFSGIRHSVEASAEWLRSGGGGVSQSALDGCRPWKLEVEVRPPAVRHTVKIQA